MFTQLIGGDLPWPTDGLIAIHVAIGSIHIYLRRAGNALFLEALGNGLL